MDSAIRPPPKVLLVHDGADFEAHVRHLIAAGLEVSIARVTENGTTSEIDRAMRAGCTSVLVKPCLPHTLLDEIRRVLGLPAPAA